MKKLYCVICSKYRKFEKLKTSNLLEKTVLSIVCSKSKNGDENLFKEEKSNWDIKKSWFNWKYIITLKRGQKKK